MDKMTCVRAMAVTDAAYLAGLIDGEGTVTLVRRHSRENRRICLSICNTGQDLLEFAKRATGVGHISRRKCSSARHSPAFTWAVWGRQALGILRQCHPWMRSYKRDRTSLALSQYVLLTPRNGKYTTGLRKARTRFEIQLLSLTPRMSRKSADGRANPATPGPPAL